MELHNVPTKLNSWEAVVTHIISSMRRSCPHTFDGWPFKTAKIESSAEFEATAKRVLDHEDYLPMIPFFLFRVWQTVTRGSKKCCGAITFVHQILTAEENDAWPSFQITSGE
jgi:hypothetical protein